VEVKPPIPLHCSAFLIKKNLCGLAIVLILFVLLEALEMLLVATFTMASGTHAVACNQCLISFLWVPSTLVISQVIMDLIVSHKVGTPNPPLFIIAPSYYCKNGQIFIFSCWQVKGSSNVLKNATFGHHMQKLWRIKVFLEDVLNLFLPHRFILTLEMYTKLWWQF